MSAAVSAADVEMFRSVTGGSLDAAKKHLQAADGDVQQAIINFMESGEGPAADADDGPAGAASAAASAPGNIDSILGLARGGDKGEASADKGKGKGKLDDLATRKVGIVFFADGFMVDEDGEADDGEEEEEEKEEAPKPFVRKAGMMTLDSMKSEDGGKGDRPKLPKKIPKLGLLRKYDTPENKAFLADINAGKVPKDLQKRDDKGKPMYTTIAVSDERPKTYAELDKLLDQMRKMKEQFEAEDNKSKAAAPAAKPMFTGAGNTCGSSSAAAPAAVAGSGACDPELLRLVKGGVLPVVDESKPATNLQLRLSNGTRVKARLNLDHTVADLWRLVSKEMGDSLFATSSGHELKAGFPPKPLTDFAATLAAADLANASVTHRCQ